MKMISLAKQLGLGAVLAFSVSLLMPVAASAQESLPDLEGTTYGLMLSDLQMQLDKLEGASSGEYDAVLHETAMVMAEQSQIMIRMIDALHDKVNGLIEDDDATIEAGYHKFEILGEKVNHRHMRWSP
ncbi:MAG: hypothetical protein EA347_00780 [Thioalkalivibrio sp.]|nr:MAG: hypothetical protein EA347_00780 [Thioalkalivibrio sp.]